MGDGQEDDTVRVVLRSQTHPLLHAELVGVATQDYSKR